MPLNSSEKAAIAQAFLQCFGEDAYWCGRTLKFVSVFTNSSVNLLQSVQDAATTWQPFIDSGLSVEWWKTELARNYNLTTTG